MDWKLYIHSDPDVLTGKPVLKGTRLSVDFILNLLASGWTENRILDNYPTVSKDSLHAVFAFAAECIKDEALYTLSSKVA